MQSRIVRTLRPGSSFSSLTSLENNSAVPAFMKLMFKKTIIVIFIAAIAVSAKAQKPWELGAEYMRSIGKGFNSSIVGARYETFPSKSSWSIGLTYALSSKKSYSSYKGFGMYVGWRYAFAISSSGKGNAFAGLRIHGGFENFEGKTNLGSLMFTPMAELGYQMIFKTHYFASPSIGFGYKKKITKENNSLDEDEGGRILPSISAGYRF